MRKKYLRFFVLLFASLFFTACSQLQFAIVNAPLSFSDTELIKNIVFTDKSKDIGLDIISPSNPMNAPVIVFFYGGSWKEGAKENYHFVGNYFAELGYIVVIPDYRKYPRVKFSDFMEDGAEALEWTNNNIAKYGGNRGAINVMGHSAGALIGALLATDERYLHAKIEIKSFIGLSGPYDFVPTEEDFVDMFGPPANYPNMQVTTFIDGQEPPMLFVYGEKDDVVGRSNLTKLSKALEDEGNVFETIFYPDLDHADTVASLTWIYEHKAPVGKEIAAFMDKKAQ
ncbi:alpha/beta hydrolase [Ningiella sp. W23]|uniref:alpha/beta hydrolase n=1 Tax=Ningiella sp. W23 TaxID=3023715 RepID=UPI003757F147